MKEDDKFEGLIKTASKIVIIQADNPDGDSLGSAIALEQILTGQAKDVSMFCAVDIPKHLKYLTGWSRVSSDLPASFDLSIIVDTSKLELLEKMSEQDLKKVNSKPLIVLDHHDTELNIKATLNINRPVVATGELIYDLATKLKWTINQEAKDMLSISIMSDSLGLIAEATTAQTIRVIADLVEGGVSLTKIDALRRDTMRKSLELTKYKGQLLERIESYHGNQLSLLVIPWAEIEKYSPLYNPPMLVIDDMRLIEGSCVAVALKVYKDGHITAKIRSNDGFPIAAKLAEEFGGGGHPYASGFKTSDYSLEQIKPKVIETAASLLEQIKK